MLRMPAIHPRIRLNCYMNTGDLFGVRDKLVRVYPNYVMGDRRWLSRITSNVPLTCDWGLVGPGLVSALKVPFT